MIQINGMAHVNLTVTSFRLPLNSMGNSCHSSVSKKCTKAINLCTGLAEGPEWQSNHAIPRMGPKISSKPA